MRAGKLRGALARLNTHWITAKFQTFGKDSVIIPWATYIIWEIA